MSFFGPLIGCCIRNSQPNIKPRGAGIIMIIYGLLVLVFGIWLLMTARKVVEVVVPYSNLYDSNHAATSASRTSSSRSSKR